MSELNNNSAHSAEEGLDAYAAAQADSDRAHSATSAANPAESPATPAGSSRPADSPAANAPNADSATDGASGAKADSEELTVADLAAAQEARITQLTEDLARANANYYNLEQEYNNYVRRSKAEIPTYRQSGIADVVGALLSVLDDIALARQHGDLTGPFQAVAEKLENTLDSKFQVRRFGQAGQAFDPQLHQAIQFMDGQGTGTDTVILQVAQPGYLHADKVLRPAMVIAGQGEVTVEAQPGSTPAGDPATGGESPKGADE